ncbi:MAG: UPF0182 family protein [Chloroflexota bacterium]
MTRMSFNDNNDRQHPLRVVGSRKEVIDQARRVGWRQMVGLRGILSYFLVSALTATFVLILQGPMLAAHVHVNIWWFQSIGQGNVYGTVWTTEKNLFLLYSVLSYLFFTVIFFVTRGVLFRPGLDPAARWIGSSLTLIVGFLATIIAIISGHTMASEWQQYLLANHAQTFGVVDPIHHRDVGFYVFAMPWRQTLGGFALALLILGAIEIGGLATIFTVTSPFETMEGDVRRIVGIGSLFAAVLFTYLSWRNFYLNPYDLTQPGTAYGGGATFAHASLWWYTVVGTVELVVALALLVNTVVRRSSLAWLALVPVVVGLSASAGQGIFQHFVVSPNELSAEYPYLGYALNFTRHAYGMDTWKVKEYTPQTLTVSDVNANKPTVLDARIADSGAFTQVIRQRQENRTYYGFNTADVDRYLLKGRQRQVLLAARELDYGKLSFQAQTWVNEHLKFTHGYGLTMSPANTVTPDGQPSFWIENVPVQETISQLPPVTQPRVYFGEYTNSWSLTNATTPEFDSSTADQDTSYRYNGPDGVTLDSGLRRLTLAWTQEGGFPFFDKLQISGYIRPSTRILLHRNIYDRVQAIAPWLTLDSNPYMVLRKNGSLVWILDGLTNTDHYPYSEPTNGVNYQRNSVKVVLDAYTGRTTFYAFDAGDPILHTWSNIFPGLIHSLAEMPADIRAHIKYPDDYLNWQASAYNRYHVTNVTSYYNGDNEWDVENSNTYNWDAGTVDTNRLQPIWTVARLFGEKQDSFFSILPFSVHGKATMAGYLAANNNTYGVTALDMPRGAQTTGATQFESLYEQAPIISSQLSLLDQHGSQVVPGQMLILPVGKALLYIKPLYLRSASAQSLPQLIRVVVGTQNEVNWGYTLKGALNNLLTQGDISNVRQGSITGPAPSTSPTPGPAVPLASGKYASMSDSRLITLAGQYYTAAQQTPSLTAKDDDLKQLGLILETLRTRHPR